MLNGGMPIAMRVTACTCDWATAIRAIILCIRTHNLAMHAPNRVFGRIFDWGAGFLSFLEPPFFFLGLV